MNQALKKKFKIIIPQGLDNNQKGRFWEEVSAEVFRKQEWKILEDIRFSGMQIDIKIEHEYLGHQGLVECKFHESSIDAPTIVKLIGSAYIRDCKCAYLLATSELNRDAKGLVDEYNTKNKDIKFIFWGKEILAEKFSKDISLPDLKQNGIGRIDSITLLITHSKEFFWVAEEIGNNNIPERLIIFPTSDKPTLQLNSREDWKNYFCTHNIKEWESLDIIYKSGKYSKSFTNITDNTVEKKVIISPINKSDSFDDYHRPCRPEYFIGREDIEKQFYTFTENVIEQKTDTRVICFSGKSGVGKSSLVVKLSEHCLKKNSKFYIYGIDVTSINDKTASLFIMSAIQKAFQEAIDESFIELHQHKIFIESSEPPLLSSHSIKTALDYLQAHQKVLVIFFDQFEEILSKPSLNSLFESFKQLAYEVDSLKSNLILGFCWRNDIIVSVDYSTDFYWNDWKKIRKDIELHEFLNSEVKQFIIALEEFIGEPLDQTYKKFIEKSCPGYPWLLRKLSSSDGNMLKQQLKQNPDKNILDIKDIKIMFDKEIDAVAENNEAKECLEFIAKNSPINKLEVTQHYDEDIINYLIQNKLIVMNGQNYKPYWDIFSEYLLQGKLPDINIRYRFRTEIVSIMEIFRLLKENKNNIKLGNIRKQDFIKKCEKSTRKTNKTINSSLIDLYNFFPCYYNKQSKNIIFDNLEILDLSDHQIADYLYQKLQAHILIKKLEKINKEFLRDDDLIKIIKEESPTSKTKTISDYKSRVLSWFLFSGLLERQHQDFFVMSHGKGKQKGDLEQCSLSKSSSQGTQLNIFE